MFYCFERFTCIRLFFFYLALRIQELLYFKSIFVPVIQLKSGLEDSGAVASKDYSKKRQLRLRNKFMEYLKRILDTEKSSRQ